jgi:putative transposase
VYQILMDKFKNKYRIQSARLQNWDYGSSGMYFITICTKNREHYFDEILDATVETQYIASLQRI